MQVANEKEIQHFRQLLKRSGVVRTISAEDIDASDCSSMYRLLFDNWTGVPTPNLLLEYAKGTKPMPLVTYKKLVDIYLE
ncbi:hypothetical protein LCX39_004441 [Vibrio vulnificus]|nr:hypothetical protein [Vibrio vulnificus]EJS4046595.1 hypothetical protein [Vibrio vulnificus]